MKMLLPDWIVVFSVILLLTAHLTTNYIITLRMDLAKTLKVSEKAVKLAEANPIAKMFINVEGISYIFTYAIMPALIFSMYYYIRKRFSYDMVIVELYSIFFFVVAFLDAMNDLAVLLAHLA